MKGARRNKQRREENKSRDKNDNEQKRLEKMSWQNEKKFNIKINIDIIKRIGD